MLGVNKPAEKIIKNNAVKVPKGSMTKRNIRIAEINIDSVIITSIGFKAWITK